MCAAALADAILAGLALTDLALVDAALPDAGWADAVFLASVNFDLRAAPGRSVVMVMCIPLRRIWIPAAFVATRLVRVPTMPLPGAFFHPESWQRGRR